MKLVELSLAQLEEVRGGCPNSGMAGWACRFLKEWAEEELKRGLKEAIREGFMESEKNAAYREKHGQPSVLYDDSSGWYRSSSGGGSYGGGGGAGYSVISDR